jgi:hypothetical protein
VFYVLSLVLSLGRFGLYVRRSLLQNGASLGLAVRRLVCLVLGPWFDLLRFLSDHLLLRINERV